MEVCFVMCVGVLTHAYVCTVHAVPKEARRGRHIPRDWSYRFTRPCGCWKLNLGPLPAESSPQLLDVLFLLSQVTLLRTHSTTHVPALNFAVTTVSFLGCG